MAESKAAAAAPSLESRISGNPVSASKDVESSSVPAEAASEAPTETEEDNLVNNNYDVTVKLADMQGDPNSPLYSVKRFEDLGM